MVRYSPVIISKKELREMIDGAASYEDLWEKIKAVSRERGIIYNTVDHEYPTRVIGPSLRSWINEYGDLVQVNEEVEGQRTRRRRRTKP